MLTIANDPLFNRPVPLATLAHPRRPLKVAVHSEVASTSWRDFSAA